MVKQNTNEKVKDGNKEKNKKKANNINKNKKVRENKVSKRNLNIEKNSFSTLEVIILIFISVTVSLVFGSLVIKT